MEPIPSHPSYLISRDGKVWSKKSNRYLKIQTNKNGYLRIALCENKKRTHFTIHQLVANAFIPNPNNYPTVNHINGKDITNNNVNNLEWCTHAENTQHAHDTGLIKAYKRAVLCYDKDDNFIKKYISASEAARILNKKSSTHICDACSGNVKTAYGFVWKYENELIKTIPKDLEDWKFIDGYRNKYKISKNGEVWSFLRNKLLTIQIQADKMKKIHLMHKTYLLHRLVAKTYVANPNNDKWVRFKDGNCNNINVDNLKWCTTEESIKV